MEEVLCNCILNVNSDNYSDLIYEAINTLICKAVGCTVKKKWILVTCTCAELYNVIFIPNQTLKDEYRKGELVSLYWTG